jgi:hypothetical protein
MHLEPAVGEVDDDVGRHRRPRVRRTGSQDAGPQPAPEVVGGVLYVAERHGEGVRDPGQVPVGHRG